MANLTDQQLFDAAVYELSTTDPVMGGPGGVDNKPHQQLANRTAWLKQQVDALLAAGGSAADIANAINTHLAAADPHVQYTTDTEVIALINTNMPSLASLGAEPASANIQQHIASPHQPLLTASDVNASAIVKSGVDYNTLIDGGFYSCINGANAPLPNTSIYLTVVRHDSLWVHQTAQSFNSDSSWSRKMINGSWSVWLKNQHSLEMSPVSKAANVIYTSGNSPRAIAVSHSLTLFNGACYLFVDFGGSGFIPVQSWGVNGSVGSRGNLSYVIPANTRYQVAGNVAIIYWSESL